MHILGWIKRGAEPLFVISSGTCDTHMHAHMHGLTAEDGEAGR